MSDLGIPTWYQSVIADHRRTRGHQPSRAIVAENSCLEVTEVVSSRAATRKGDAVPTSSRVCQEEVAQWLRKLKEAL